MTRRPNFQEDTQDTAATNARREWDREGECLADIEEQARLYGSTSAAHDNAVLKWLGVFRDDMRPDDVYADDGERGG